MHLPREPASSDSDPSTGDERSRLRLRGRVGSEELSFLLAPGDNPVGSSGANAVVLRVRGVSRRHACLRGDGGGYTVEDLGSKNGTFVNGRQVRRSPVLPGDEVGFGPVSLRVETLAAGDVELAIDLGKDGDVSVGSEVVSRATPLLSGGEEGGRPPPPDRPATTLTFPPGYVPGESPAMRSLYRQMEQMAAGDLPVLVVGETGAGKEPVAHALHAASPRRRGPLVAVNCAAIPADLLEAEMFGIGKGAATGVAARRGKFVEAAGGTLLLDEIGDMPVQLQAKLLRALQDKEVQPVGLPPVAVDVRIVAATNQELRARIAAGQFRSDLYYRIAGYVLRIPPLRERPEDLPRLVGQFLSAAGREVGKMVRGLTVKALGHLTDYPWPGNVRELENAVRQLVYRCAPGGVIDSTMLPDHILSPPEERDPAASEPTSLDLADHTEVLERRLIRLALARSRGNQTRAAQLLGISRNGLANRLKRLGIDADREPGQD
jgi:transcriptional regulator with AAA-type ATPase domain